MRISSHPSTFTSTFNRRLSWVVWAALLCAAVVTLWLPHVTQRAGVLIILVALAAVTYVGLWLPRLSVSDTEITVRNVLHTTVVPWNALIHVDTKYSLTLHVPGATITVFSAPAPGRATAHRIVRQRSAAGRTEFMRPGDLPGTDSGDAAGLVRERWAHLQSSGAVQAGVADSTAVARRWNLGAGAVLCAAIAAPFAALPLL